MPKFADLHKNLDDAFNKDFCHGAFNVEHKQAVDAGDLGAGSLTFKLNHNPIVGATSGSLENKHTIGPGGLFGLAPSLVNGVVITKNIAGSKMKHKIEKALECGTKVTYDTELDLASHKCSKANLDAAYDDGKVAVNLKMAQAADSGAMLAMPQKVTAQVVMAAAGHHIGLGLDYPLDKSGSLSHHLKMKLNHDAGYAVVGLKNANDSELLVSHKLNKTLNVGPFGALNVANVHCKATYGLNNGAYGAQLCLDGNYEFGDFKTAATKLSYDPMSGDFKESHKFKINDNLSATVAWNSNAHAGFFKNASLGAALNFSV